MSAERVVYSIQRTYILTHVLTPEREIVTCDQRIDIPTIEPLSSVKPILYEGQPLTVIPCIELACECLSEFNLTFETNEGITVLPVKIQPGSENPLENPYITSRYVLVLPRGATGVKSCKLTLKDTGEEVQHNFTFGIMPPPYNYDNALFGFLADGSAKILDGLLNLGKTTAQLHLTTKTPGFLSIDLPVGQGKQTIAIEHGALFYTTLFNYPLSSEPITHTPKITLRNNDTYLIYVLSLNKTVNPVSIDLFTGSIRVCDRDNGEIIQQFFIPIPDEGFETLSFENFNDIADSVLRVTTRGARVK